MSGEHLQDPWFSGWIEDVNSRAFTKKECINVTNSEFEAKKAM